MDDIYYIIGVVIALGSLYVGWKIMLTTPKEQEGGVRMMDVVEAEQIAEAHAKWVYAFYKDVFLHGFKHGYEKKEQEVDEK